MRRRHLVAAVGTVAMGLSVLPLVATPAAAVSAPVVVASGLDGPYKLTFGPDGDLYVAESGRAGTENCVSETDEGGETVEICYGATGAITRIDLDGDAPTQEQVVTGLPSIGNEEGASGPVDVAFSPIGQMHVITGLGGDQEFRDHFGDPRAGTVLRVDALGESTVLSDLVAFEQDNNPDQGQPYAEEAPDSNPFGLTFDGIDVLAVDAGGNDVLRIAPDGTTTVDHVLPGGMAEAPPFLGLPPGTEIPYQPVPTAVDLDEDGIPLVGQLTGFPFPVGEANVYDVSGDDPVVREGGFTNIIDIDVDHETGNLYVLQFTDNGLLADEFAPSLIEVRPDGTQKYLLYGTDLPPLGGVEVGPDGMIYVTACTLCGPGAGMVWQLDPTVPSDPATASACMPAEVPGTTFPDIKASTHREAIECAAHWDAVTGFADGTFGPQRHISRGQAASMMARALTTAGVDVPTDAPDAFTDNGGVHESNINALAAMGIVKGHDDGTYRPSQNVTRAQIASLFVRTYAVIAEAALPAGDDAFTDDEGNVHEANIDAVAAAGWVNGVGGGRFAPQQFMVRGQFASVLMRMLSTLVDEELATPPAAG